jgi:hypothetical protein
LSPEELANRHHERKVSELHRCHVQFQPHVAEVPGIENNVDLNARDRSIFGSPPFSSPDGVELLNSLA